MATRKLKRGGARPWGRGKSAKTRKLGNSTGNANRNKFVVEAQIAALQMEADRLGRLANGATLMAKKLRTGKVSNNAVTKITRNAREINSLTNMLSGLGK